MKKIVLILFSIVALSCSGNAQKERANKEFSVQKTDSQWKAELDPQAYQILCKNSTEGAFTSELLMIKEPGTFVCAACGNELYRSENKFDSGTGWPSFDRAYKEQNIIYRPVRTGGYSALEVLCGKCGGHLGHVFNDGPEETTGKRHCVNGTAMKFIKDKEI